MGELSLDEIMKLVSKKATFEKGVRSLTRLVQEDALKLQTDGDRKQEVLAAVNRVASLLKARYTARGFWSDGLKLFQEAEALAEGDAAAVQKIAGHVAAARDILGEVGGSSSSASTHSRSSPAVPAYHFQGQLSVRDDPPPRPPIMDAEARLLQAFAMASSPNPETASVPRMEDILRQVFPVAAEDDVRESNSGRQRSSEEEQASEREEEEELGAEDQQETDIAEPSALLQGMLENLLGAGTIPGLEEAIEASLQQGGQSTAVPPASQKEVEKLPTFTVQENLEEEAGQGPTGGDQAGKDLSELQAPDSFCTVCQENWKTGDTVRQMPCTHRFHVECLQPWLDKHNSCPVCRFEMLTDDVHYEQRKERAKEEEKERQGAENAVKEGVYMYL